jgi:protein-L-isoaspartate(D-aspartate) O-methyltransferase
MKTGRFIIMLIIIRMLFLSFSCGKEPPAQESPEKVKSAKGVKQEKSDMFAEQRMEMVSSQLADRGITAETVLNAMSLVPRHEFVPGKYIDDAYMDGPLPIGFGQTISQPYIVALMTELLDVNKNSKVLEVGTGSGYQAAVLSRIVKEVYSVEIVKELSEISSAALRRTGCDNVKTHHADGYYGWPEHAPYDAIITTCASEFIPPPLIKQLKKGGRMCIPVGPPFKVQHLLLVKKSAAGEVSVEMITEVRFVPLVRSDRQ